jgi:hypothetical protein
MFSRISVAYRSTLGVSSDPGDGLYHVDFPGIHTETRLLLSQFDYLWENIETFSLAGTTVPNLSPEVWLLVLCLMALRLLATFKSNL